MIEIEWEEYVGEHLKKATDEMLDKNENNKWVGRKLPESLRQLMKAHGGQTPLNLVPIYPNGEQMAISCIYHAYFEGDEYDAYTIPFTTSAIAEQGYFNYVVFSSHGNVFLCLDYNVREIDPPVVFVFRDSPPDDPDHRYFLAENFAEFLEKYTIPMDQVED